LLTKLTFFIKNNIEFRAILRAKFNLVTNSLETQERQPVHVDYKFNHKVFLYYVNDSDGDTILFDKNYKIVEKIKPEKGKFLIFDGDILHASSPPVKSKKRMIINLNIKIKK
jgi:hypothetical protein